MRKTVLILCALLFLLPLVAAEYPQEVKNALKQAGKNSTELEKVLKHYEADSQKWKAACFLIANMNLQFTQSYYWSDKAGNKIAYSEFDYPTYEKAISAFNTLSQKSKLTPVKTLVCDLQEVTAPYLISHIDAAFRLREGRWASRLSFSDFCEYLLPYRVMDEPLTDWRAAYLKTFAPEWQKCKNKSVRQACTSVCEDLKLWFSNIFDYEVQKEPQRALSAMQILFRRQGYCEDMVNWGVYMLRSQGIASAVDFTPFWATSTGGHFWQSAFDETGKSIPFFMGDDTPAEFHMSREPSKVLRLTYSAQQDSPASCVSKEEIPDGFMRNVNYLDVTGQYWRTAPIRTRLNTRFNSQKVAYLSVMNGGKWRPVWWGKVLNGTVEYPAMSCGAVYLPMCYIDGKEIPAAAPCLLRPDGVTQELQEHKMRLRTVRIEEQKGYLIFRPGKKYTLYYWDSSMGKWQATETRTAEQPHNGHIHPLVFNRVPSNALLILIPEYSQRKERPFTIDDTGKREWW